MLHSVLYGNRERIAELCKVHHIKRLSAFGSVCRTDCSPTSDINLLYAFDEQALAYEEYAEHFLAFVQDMQSLTQRPIDLVSEAALWNPYFRQTVESTSAVLYQRGSDDDDK
jgi:hypothetical protein